MSASKLPVIPADELRRSIAMRPQNWRHPEVNVVALEEELRRSVGGEVSFDAGTKALYATDGSNYRQVPIGVVLPKSKEDAIATVAACRNFGAPLLSRGGGTSLAGQCCNIAVVMDWSKYLHNILEINVAQRWARVEPGTICDDLRKAAGKYNLTWGPDPATHDHCVFGGMLGNNSCGAHAQMAGKAVDNTEELDILLYDGTRMTVGWTDDLQAREMAQRSGREGEIYRKLLALRERYKDLVQKNYPKIPRRVSGYNLDQLIPGEDGRWNLARALVGTEATCVTFLEAKVRLIGARAKRVLLVLGYPDVYHAADHVPDILPSDPVALEGLDEFLVKNIETKGGPHRAYLPMLPEGKGWLMVELGYDTKEEALDKAHQLMNKLKAASTPPSMKLFEKEEEQEKIWAVRESGLGATAFVPGQPVTWEGWEDSAVAPEKMGGYLRDLCKLAEKYEYRSTMYGHFGQGCVHCRWNFGLDNRPGIEKWRRFMEEATDLVTSYGGSISGEHGDGQSKAEFLHKMFGPELIEAFREFKSIWDPDWKMNPGKVVDAYRIDENLRLGADYHPWEPETHFKFPEDHGSFAHAALRCVGVGKCRRMEGSKPEDDTMCPSYMVTREERHTTRGRAHMLWEMLNGGVITQGWKDDHVKEALDLCLSCKGCKGDCPVNVDMATYKAEFLAHYWEGRLRPRHAYAFGLIDQWARLASVVPGLVNLFTQLPVLRTIAKKAAGMPMGRRIPAFAPQTFQSWFRQRGPRNQHGPKVILWADTFNNYFFPEAAQAAVEVLEHFGYQVQVPMQHLCCGRPLYDYGFLDRAKVYLTKVLDALEPEFSAGTSVVVLEPSCCSVFRDEINGLMPDSDRAHRLMENTFTLSEFLEKKVENYRPPELKRSAIVQGHCHHKAIMRLKEEEAVMKKMGLDFEVLNSGCCGMAGSFGYEADKYDVSVACGERALFPAVRKAGLSAVIMADGFSCKEQIEQDTPRHGLHLAEVMQMALRHGPHGGRSIYPEDEFVQPRLRAQRRSMQRAGFVVAGAMVAGGLLWWLKRRD
ncbi:MAG: FAD-binding and (Fe-S)-binding domain-containing protein [Terriglobales bacterium]